MTDLEFARRCASGDKRAWDEFVDKYSRLIYNYIYSVFKLTGIDSSGQDSASDIFQELFVSLSKDNFKKLRSFKARNGCSFATWLRHVVVNQTIDYTRKRKVPTVSIEEENEDGVSVKDMLVDDSGVLRDLLADKERLMHLSECIDKLETQDKYFLELHINRGFSLEELKDVFKVSRGAIDMRKQRIVERLKDWFKAKEFLS